MPEKTVGKSLFRIYKNIPCHTQKSIMRESLIRKDQFPVRKIGENHPYGAAESSRLLYPAPRRVVTHLAAPGRRWIFDDVVDDVGGRQARRRRGAEQRETERAAGAGVAAAQGDQQLLLSHHGTLILTSSLSFAVMSPFHDLTLPRTTSRTCALPIEVVTGKGRTFLIWVILALRASVTRQLCIYHSHTHARDEEAPSPLRRAALRTIVGCARSLSLSFDATGRKGDKATAASCFTLHTRMRTLLFSLVEGDRTADYSTTDSRRKQQRHANTDERRARVQIIITTFSPGRWTPRNCPQLIERARGATCARGAPPVFHLVTESPPTSFATDQSRSVPIRSGYKRKTPWTSFSFITYVPICYMLLR